MEEDNKTTADATTDSTDGTDSTDKKEEKKKEDKTVLEEVTEESGKKAKGKKGKDDYKELKPEEIKAGMIVRVHQKIVDINPKGEEKERTQVFQGMVLAHKHGAESGSTITVRKVSEGIGVEKIFPLNMPSLTKFELVRKYSVRQARPYFLRTHKKRLREVKE